MNKSELVDAIASRSGLTKTDASKFLEAYNGTVTEALKAGDQVVVPGFGSWSVVSRAERLGRNPQTGATLQIKASRAPKFKPGKTFKEEIQ